MALIEVDKEQERYQALIEAFSDQAFRDELETVKGKLNVWLEEWMKGMPPLDTRIGNVFSIEARVKGLRTFEEKVYRKNYIQTWDVFTDKAENQAYITRTLTDLIGLRVNCHFVAYESYIYDYLNSTCDGQISKGFEFNFDENTTQKNGNKIYKFSGVFQKLYHFEVQIKSIVHNVWGEVEHKTVYKNPVYDGYIEKKRQISSTLHDTMMASDKELYTLFNMKETETQLIQSLFFCETNVEVAGLCKTNVLGVHYNSYFLSFPDLDDVKQYIICKLSETAFEKKTVTVESNEFFDALKKEVKKVFPKFYLTCLFNIDSILHEQKTYDDFLVYFLQHIIKVEKDDFDEAMEMDFEGDEDTMEDNSQQQIINDCLNRVDEILGGCRIK